ncbi:MAG: GspH/FimT family pseudopilin [Pseudomonadota bacterium]
MNRKHTGFSLVELMVVLAIAAIIATIAVPSFRSTLQNNRLASQANDFVATLHLARGEAVKQGRRTTVCVSDNQTSCSGTDWAKGWLAWADTNGDAAMQTSEIIRVHEALGGATLTSLEAVASIQYLPSGFLNIPAGSSRGFQLSASGCTGNEVRTITVIPTGRANISRSACP